ncbi:MAG TPA: FHA domain-containing protein [Nitrolancea sp.]|nr:FHA domain-containing protein [Nitrolancea sp.]
MINQLPFEWFVLLLRVLFIFLLYFFLFQVLRVVLRELSSFSSQGHEEAPIEATAHLIVQKSGGSGLRSGMTLELEPVTVIGRHPRATIILDDTFVSSEHVQITWRDGRWWLSDLNSTNGTRLNAQPVTVPTGLRYGDVIAIGDVHLQFAP